MRMMSISKKKKNSRGFTLAELMMAVALIGILAGVTFVGVANYMRSMAQLERDGLAKEIFIAAQNHLTMAEGQGFLGATNSTDKESDNVFYYTVNAGSRITFDNTTMLGVMLPFGSVDETIRGGNYVIRYQVNPARVLDVFYCSSGDDQYSHTFGSDDNGDNFKAATIVSALRDDDKKLTRRDYHGAVVGWYGDSLVGSLTPKETSEPTLELVNSDVLYVNVTNTNTNISTSDKLKLFVEGVTSGALVSKELSPSGEKVILDDVTTQNQHFSQIASFTDFDHDPVKGADFIPGEDIRVYAIAYNNGSISTIARSTVKTTNSLFADLVGVDAVAGSGEGVTRTNGYTEVSIGSMRHLANLYDANSGMFYVKDSTSDKYVFKPDAVVEGSSMIKAVQIDDLDWNTFLTNVKKIQNTGNTGENTGNTGENTGNTGAGESIYTHTGSSFGVTDANKYGDPTNKGCWLPINPSYGLQYNGDNHSISNVKVESSQDAGLFGTIPSGSRVENVELIDFDIKSSDGDAGALAGKMNVATIVNVLANNSSDSKYTSGSPASIIAQSGSAGGLIGSVSCGSQILVSAAALSVSASSNAGGLIGKSTDMVGDNPPKTLIRGCYSGGHLDSTHKYSSREYNVTATGTNSSAGGLIGDAGNAEIMYSYSTCSVSGITAGGFSGKATGSISGCYSTGLVAGTTRGAFAGTYSGSASNCYYYEIINEIKNEQHGMLESIDYLGAVNSNAYFGIKAFDEDVESYNLFVPANNNDSNKWIDAVPYDTKLNDYYGGKYNLKSVGQLAASATMTVSQLAGYRVSVEGAVDQTDYYVTKHYGDWPAPEIFVINETESSSGE